MIVCQRRLQSVAWATGNFAGSGRSLAHEFARSAAEYSDWFRSSLDDRGSSIQWRCPGPGRPCGHQL